MEIAGEPLTVIPVIAAACQIPPFLVDKVYVDFTADYFTGLSRLLSCFVARADMKDVLPSLVREWTKRIEVRAVGEFREFVKEELRKREREERRAAFQHKKCSENLVCLLQDTVRVNATTGKRLAQVAMAYGRLSECSRCGVALIAITRLAEELRKGHMLRMPTDEIAVRLSRFRSAVRLSRFRAGVPLAVCLDCSAKDYQDP